MKKLILLTAVMILTSAVCLAQKHDGLKFSVGPELALTTGNFSNTHSIGIGGTAQLEFRLQEKLQGVAYGGIIFYNGKSSGTGTKYKGTNIIPLRVGVKYFLTPGIYGGLQAGVGIVGGYTASKGTAFSYSPQLGYEFETKNGKSVDVTLKYDGYAVGGGLGSFGLRVAYLF